MALVGEGSLKSGSWRGPRTKPHYTQILPHQTSLHHLPPPHPPTPPPPTPNPTPHPTPNPTPTFQVPLSGWAQMVAFAGSVELFQYNDDPKRIGAGVASGGRVGGRLGGRLGLGGVGVGGLWGFVGVCVWFYFPPTWPRGVGGSFWFAFDPKPRVSNEKYRTPSCLLSRTPQAPWGLRERGLPGGAQWLPEGSGRHKGARLEASAPGLTQGT